MSAKQLHTTVSDHVRGEWQAGSSTLLGSHHRLTWSAQRRPATTTNGSDEEVGATDLARHSISSPIEMIQSPVALLAPWLTPSIYCGDFLVKADLAGYRPSS